jgi:hypothetical protein
LPGILLQAAVAARKSRRASKIYGSKIAMRPSATPEYTERMRLEP